jgi:predicted transposase/invertase (TIGR01784 family)
MVKNVFGTQKNIGNTRGFLKAVLDLDPAEYKSMKIGDPHLHRRWKKDKLGIVDIKINTASGKVLHIEVQVDPGKDFIPRGMYYNNRLLVDQVGVGKRYKAIRRSISVMVVNFTLLKNEPPDRYKNVFRFLNTISHEPFTDLQEIVILELPKVPEEDDGTSLRGPITITVIFGIFRGPRRVKVAQKRAHRFARLYGRALAKVFQMPNNGGA